MPNYERISTHNNDSSRSRTVAIWTEKAGRIVLFGCSVACNVFLQGSSAAITASAFAAMTLTTSATDIARFVRDKDKLRTRDKFSLPISWALATFSTIGYIIFTVKAPALSGFETAAISAVINLVAASPTATIPQLTNWLLDRHSGHNVAARVPVSAEGENEQGEAEIRLVPTNKEDPFAAQRDIFVAKTRKTLKELTTNYRSLTTENEKLELLRECENIAEKLSLAQLSVSEKEILKQRAREIRQKLNITQEINIPYLINKQIKIIGRITKTLAPEYQDIGAHLEHIRRESLEMTRLEREINEVMRDNPLSPAKPTTSRTEVEIAAQAPQAAPATVSQISHIGLFAKKAPPESSLVDSGVNPQLH